MHQACIPRSMPDRGKGRISLAESVSLALASFRECHGGREDEDDEGGRCATSAGFSPVEAFRLPPRARLRSIYRPQFPPSFPSLLFPSLLPRSLGGRLLAGIIGEGIKAAKLRVVEDKGRKRERASEGERGTEAGGKKSERPTERRRLTNRISFRLSIHPSSLSLPPSLSLSLPLSLSDLPSSLH